MENTPIKSPIFIRAIPSKEYYAQDLIIEALEYLNELKESGYANKVSEFNFRLVLDEAIVNAINHGNCNDPKKKVSVIIRGYLEKVDIIIQDEGNGFSSKGIPNPKDKDIRFASHGRGLFLLCNIAKISWNKIGNCMKIELSE
jgi:serine/threonine-protein kinase RsbW